MRRRRTIGAVALAATLLGRGAAAAAPPQQDAILAAFIQEALGSRPELSQARADVQVAQERVTQAQAMPDPVLQVGVQNDSFNQWQVGTMESSWVLFMASQTFPFPGKRGLRAELASTEVRDRELATERVRLQTIAEVRRAYLAVQLAGARLELLAKLRGLIEQSIAVAEARYEIGEGVQSDLLRARLELARLQQQRLQVEANGRLQAQALNRLRAAPLDERIEGAPPFAALSFPPIPDEAASLSTFRDQSPEVLSTATGVLRAERARALSERSYYPDLSVSAGVMVRGSLEPMWTVTVGVPLPVFAGDKQSRAVAEAEALRASASRGSDALEQLLRLRIHQRIEYWGALEEMWQAYQGGLLKEAEAASESTLTQYRVGKVAFTSVLEASSTAISAIDASYGVLAEAWRLAIAHDELSLGESGSGGGVVGTGALGGGGASMSAARGGAASGSASSTVEMGGPASEGRPAGM